MRIVIVEDEMHIREGLKKLLGKLSESYQVVGEAEDGIPGLAMIRELQPDLVITDIRMPGMDGLQMLETLSAEENHPMAIVLSAYSEFEYARKAMKLGVTEYLLKPISVQELLQSMLNMEAALENKHRKKPDSVGTREQIFRDFLEGTVSDQKEVLSYLKHDGISEETKMLMTLVYLGAGYDENCEKVARSGEYFFSVTGGDNVLLRKPDGRSLVYVCYHYGNRQDFERALQQHILAERLSGAAFGCIEVDSIIKLAEGYRILMPKMDWNIAFNSDILISYPKIATVQTVPCIYPLETETACKVAVCAGDLEKARECLQEFFGHFKDGQIYEPREIKENYIRFLWAVIGIAKDVGCLGRQELNQQEVLELISRAKHRQELEEIALRVMDCVSVEEDDSVTHLTVKRALNLIKEFYHTGITLDQIAEKLNITPEYLGTQFHKEVGVNFSAYIRNCRINRAKELLCSTDLKLYAIAEKVGYSDPKYFSKVFKEVTGQLPAEYRKTHK